MAGAQGLHPAVEHPRPARILLTGGNGQVGWSLRPLLAEIGEVFAPTRAELDLSSPQSIRDAVRSFRPDWIVNAAAYTAVDKAESEPEAANAVNRDAVAVMAEEATRAGAAMVHYSTDYVFDGAKAAPYIEKDATNPLGVYGMSKLLGEQALTASGAAHLTFRTSWVYGARGKNLLLTILKLAREREELRIVADQHGAPTWCGEIARLTAETVRAVAQRATERGSTASDALLPMSGIYHLCNSGETTWHGFAVEAVRQARDAQKPASGVEGHRFARLVPIATAEYPTPTARPANSRLDCGKLRRVFGCEPEPWERSLTRVMEQLGAAAPQTGDSA